MRYFFILCLILMPLLAHAHGIHDQHNHKESKGGPLLNGYPWGLFAPDLDFHNRVIHKTNNQELELANKIFEALAVGSYVSFPLNLDNAGFNPFGDGQANGQASFESWTFNEPPLMAVLDKSGSQLSIQFHQSIHSVTTSLDVRFPNGSIQNITRSENHELVVNLEGTSLNWSSFDQGKVIYVKPSHWQDWFAVKFQTQYVLNHAMTKVNPNPLGINATNHVPPLLQLMSLSQNSEDYLIFTSDLVHSIYPDPDHPDFVHKSSGGNWTFLLNPTHWQGDKASTFKQLYSCFSGRAHWEESIRKSVSGTSWHFVGDAGENILNSVEGETRSLVTAIGEQVNPPEGITLAYGLNFVGFAGMTPPKTAFITKQGQYHWHPVHTTEPVCVEVYTPPCIPSDDNGYGFQCK